MMTFLRRICGIWAFASHRAEITQSEGVASFGARLEFNKQNTSSDIGLPGCLRWVDAVEKGLEEPSEQ
jgi:hypothetical protein